MSGGRWDRGDGSGDGGAQPPAPPRATSSLLDPDALPPPLPEDTKNMTPWAKRVAASVQAGEVDAVLNPVVDWGAPGRGPARGNKNRGGRHGGGGGGGHHGGGGGGGRKQKCKAPDCTENHAQHFCKMCRSRDANHRSANCPAKKGKGAKATKAKNGPHCKAYPKCVEAHEKHYCKYCKDKDADHRSFDCKKKGAKGASTPGKKGKGGRGKGGRGGRGRKGRRREEEDDWVPPPDDAPIPEGRPEVPGVSTVPQHVRVAMQVLNKLSVANYDRLSAQLLDVDMRTPQDLVDVVHAIHQKALLDPTFAYLYARLCQDVAVNYGKWKFMTLTEVPEGTKAVYVVPDPKAAAAAAAGAGAGAGADAGAGAGAGAGGGESGSGDGAAPAPALVTVTKTYPDMERARVAMTKQFFKGPLLGMCQQQFEAWTKAEGDQDMDDESRIKAKLLIIGNVQFVGHLFCSRFTALNIVPTRLIEIIFNLLGTCAGQPLSPAAAGAPELRRSSPDFQEMAIDQICALVKTVWGQLKLRQANARAAYLMKLVEGMVEAMSKDESRPNRSRFICMDSLDKVIRAKPPKFVRKPNARVGRGAPGRSPRPSNTNNRNQRGGNSGNSGKSLLGNGGRRPGAGSPSPSPGRGGAGGAGAGTRGSPGARAAPEPVPEEPRSECKEAAKKWMLYLVESEDIATEAPATLTPLLKAHSPPAFARAVAEEGYKIATDRTEEYWRQVSDETRALALCPATYATLHSPTATGLPRSQVGKALGAVMGAGMLDVGGFMFELKEQMMWFDDIVVDVPRFGEAVGMLLGPALVAKALPLPRVLALVREYVLSKAQASSLVAAVLLSVESATATAFMAPNEVAGPVGDILRAARPASAKVAAALMALGLPGLE